MKTARADRAAAGFTLVELLVSMAVLALLAVTMAAGLRFTARAVASTDSRREAMEELTLGLSVLRGELERAEPLVRKVGNRDLVMFSGLGERLRFVNVEPPYLAGLPYLVYEYAVTLDGRAYRVDLRRAPLDPDQPDLAAVEAVEPRTVLRLTQPLRFTYWGRLRPRDPPAWHDEWPPGAALPEAIRLAQGEAPGWPDLVVPLRITAPWYCGAGGPVGGGGGGGEEGAAATGGTAGCPGTREGPGEDTLLAPGTAVQTPFGEDDAAPGRGRSREPGR